MDRMVSRQFTPRRPERSGESRFDPPQTVSDPPLTLFSFDAPSYRFAARAFPFFLWFFDSSTTACAAANRAIGTRNGEALT
jgi:hypothetical protein